MPLGIVRTYNKKRGFGFLETLAANGKPVEGVPQLFFHVSQLDHPDAATDIIGERVAYEVGPNRSRQALINPTRNTMAIKLRFV